LLISKITGDPDPFGAIYKKHPSLPELMNLIPLAQLLTLTVGILRLGLLKRETELTGIISRKVRDEFYVMQLRKN